MSSRKIKPRTAAGVSKEWRLCSFCQREWPRLYVRRVPGKLRGETDAEREETMYRIEAGLVDKAYVYRDAQRRRVYICPDCFKRAAIDAATGDRHAGEIVSETQGHSAP